MTARRAASLPPEYFSGLYGSDPDPWRFATSDYERAKYAATLAALPNPRYASGLEVGCSIGVFTRQLASRCEALLALDAVPAVLDATRERCADQAHVRVRRLVVPGEWPEERFDLVVLSEVAYYLARPDLTRLVERLRATLSPGGDCVLVHWLGETDYPLTGDEAAHGIMTEAADFASLRHHQRTASYRIDILRRHATTRASSSDRPRP